MTFQRRFRREAAFEIFIPVGATSRSRPRPIGQRQIGRRPRLALGTRFIRVEIIMSGIEIGGGTEIFGGEGFIERRRVVEVIVVRSAGEQCACVSPPEARSVHTDSPNGTAHCRLSRDRRAADLRCRSLFGRAEVPGRQSF